MAAENVGRQMVDEARNLTGVDGSGGRLTNKGITSRLNVLRDLEPGGELSIGPFQVLTAPLPHPRPNLGFRISVGGRSLVYTGDCGPSDGLIHLADGANLLLAEASYAETVPPEIVGSLSSAVDVGREAASGGVQRLVLTHLMPKTNEANAVAAAARYFAGPIAVARPGLVVEA